MCSAVPRRFIALCLAAVIAQAVAARAAELQLPDFCRVQVERIEEAYQAGLAKAATEADRLEAGRIRYAALAVLVELTYQSTLAWLAEDAESQARIRDNQMRWLDRRDAILPVDELLTTTSSAKLDDGANLMLQRLRYFASITAEAEDGPSLLPQRQRQIVGGV